MLTVEELKQLMPDKVVDARGTACPGPLLEAKRSMAAVQVGQIMEVQSSDPGTQRDIPRWSEKMGHDFLGVIEIDGYAKIFIKKLK